MGPDGATQGLLPARQICPTAALPLGEPFTSHVTFGSGVPATVAVSASSSPGATEAFVGDTATVTPLTNVTTAKSVAAPDEVALAWIVTTLGDGKSAGAV